MKSIAIGSSYVHRVTPTAADTAAALGNAGVDVVSTPSLIAQLEQACHLVIASAYEPGEVSVGVRVAVDHVAAARVGEPLEVTATLTTHSARRLGFDVKVVQAGREIMHGEHERAVVELERFRRGAGATDCG